MDQKISNFQIMILVVFTIITIGSIVLFATSKSKNNNGTGVALEPVVMWGTAPEELINNLVLAILEKDKDLLDIKYFKKDAKTFQQDLIEAIADDVGPDIVIIPQDMIIKNLNKVVVLPYKSYPLRNFKDNFIDVGSVFLKSDGVIALPFIIDPMIMYWNKTHFVNAGVINPPKLWDEFSADVSKLTKKDSNFNILQSGTALGEYQNILHAKDILSMLFLQAGVSVVSKTSDDEFVADLFYKNINSEKNSAGMALSFYTDFANTSKDSYSWNKSLKPSRDSFISGDTSTYFGYASELAGISLKNPNLNFDVEMVPQVVGAEKKSVYANVYGLAVLKSSKKQVSAFSQVFTLISKESISELVSIINLPPVRKDVLVNIPTDPYMKIFYDSALIADTWIDPDSNSTDTVFKNMIEGVIVGRDSYDSSINTAKIQITQIIQNTKNK
jgi:ABC-type glycerol-3-phosphate transport system substrate-binding protein